MSTATAEPQTEQETVVFVSRCPNQVLTRRQSRHIVNAHGTREELKESDWLEQHRAINRARLERGEDPIEIDETPWKVEFHNSEFKTANPELIEWLRGHRLFNYNGPSGFFELEKPLDEREPTTAEQMRAIHFSLLHRDLSAAEATLQVEQETHRRPQVIQAAEAAVSDITELLNADASGADTGNGAPPSTPSSS